MRRKDDVPLSHMWTYGNKDRGLKFFCRRRNRVVAIRKIYHMPINKADNRLRKQISINCWDRIYEGLSHKILSTRYTTLSGITDILYSEVDCECDYEENEEGYDE